MRLHANLISHAPVHSWSFWAQRSENNVQKNIDDELERQRLDLALDRELQDTFPASDALKITQRQPDWPLSKRQYHSPR